MDLLREKGVPRKWENGENRPGRCGDCSPQLPQIQTCAINASGSSRHGLTCAWLPGGVLFTAPRGSESPTCRPPPDPRRGAPFPRPGPRRTGSPAPHGTMERSDSLRTLRPPFLVVRLAVPSRAPGFAPSGPTPAWGPGPFGLAVPPRQRYRDGAAGSPRFPGRPVGPMPCSSTPAGPVAPRPDGTPAWPPIGQRRRLSAGNALEAQEHGLGPRCLRFAVALAVPPTQDSLPVAGWALPGGITNPQGCYEEFPRFYLFSSLPELSWRNVSSFFSRLKKMS